MLIKIFGNKYLLSRNGLLPIIPDFGKAKKLEGHDKLKGRVSLIIGGNSGIGLSVVKTFLREGATVIASARHLGELEAINSSQFEFLKWDIAEVETSKKHIDYLFEKYGFVDDIVICAGVNVCPNNNETDYVKKKWIETEFVHSINVIGVCEICKYILEKAKNLKTNRQPKVINVISSGAYMATPEPYFTSKHALMSFTKAFMKESEGFLRVYGICPGEVRTKMIVHGLFTLFSRFTKDRRKGHPDEIAELALLLCSPAGDYMKSNICVLDGGERILEQF